MSREINRGETYGDNEIISKYEQLLAERNKLLNEIQEWKNEFEKREGRKCTEADCEAIRDLYRGLKRNRVEILILKGQELDPNDNKDNDKISFKEDNMGMVSFVHSEGGRT